MLTMTREMYNIPSHRHPLSRSGKVVQSLMHDHILAHFLASRHRHHRQEYSRRDEGACGKLPQWEFDESRCRCRTATASATSPPIGAWRSDRWHGLRHPSRRTSTTGASASSSCAGEWTTFGQTTAKEHAFASKAEASRAWMAPLLKEGEPSEPLPPGHRAAASAP